MPHGGTDEIGIGFPKYREEGVTQLAETGLLTRVISVRFRAPSRSRGRVRGVNAAHRALTSRSGGSSPSGRTGASMVDSGALNAVKRVRFPQPHGSTIFDNLTARDGRRFRRWRSLRTYMLRRAVLKHGSAHFCEVRRMARQPTVNRPPKGTGGSIPSLAARRDSLCASTQAVRKDTMGSTPIRSTSTGRGRGCGTWLNTRPKGKPAEQLESLRIPPPVWPRAVAAP